MNMNNSPRRDQSGFVYYMHDESTRFRFDLIGNLSKDAVQDLEQARQTASSVFYGRCLIVDLTRLTTVDVAGRQLLEEWHARGAQLVVASPDAKRRIQSMTSVPITVTSVKPESSHWLRRTATLGLAGLLAALMLATAVAAVAWLGDAGTATAVQTMNSSNRDSRGEF